MFYDEIFSWITEPILRWIYLQQNIVIKHHFGGHSPALGTGFQIRPQCCQTRSVVNAIMPIDYLPIKKQQYAENFTISKTGQRLKIAEIFPLHWHEFANLCTSVTKWSLLAVREITKSSSTFSATNISSNIVWLLWLHDIIQMKSNYTLINYNPDNITIRRHILTCSCVWNLIFDTKFRSIYLAKGEKCSIFRLSFVNLQRAKDGTHMFDANIDMCLLYKSHQMARLVSYLMNNFSKWMFTM